ncbi:NUDIX domain-containing protein [Candidatus Nomurabacteria bacterium]|nr:NUDIX domain-containing protein [Candidatus Nomurabacteria bacterium]
MFKIGVFAIIFDEEGCVLLCHRNDYDLWNLPGGGLEVDETPEDGVVREVLEETGLEVEVDRLTGVYTKVGKNELVFSFLCRIKGGRLKTTDEADKVEYFSVDQIPKNTSPKQVQRIKDYLETPDKTLFKIQTGASSIELIKQGKL